AKKWVREGDDAWIDDGYSPHENSFEAGAQFFKEEMEKEELLEDKRVEGFMEVCEQLKVKLDLSRSENEQLKQTVAQELDDLADLIDARTIRQKMKELKNLRKQAEGLQIAMRRLEESCCCSPEPAPTCVYCDTLADIGKVVA
ncbi:MAG TPA: hypothetical protein VIJ14_06585, partial [Rhabdochlamydiaceae bacterium]